MRKILTLAALLPACMVPYAGPGDPYAQPPAAVPGPAYAPPPGYAPPPAYPSGPQQGRRLGRDEATQLAWRYAAQRGLQPAGVHEAEHDEGRWKVELDLAGGGEAKVVIDAWSGAELRFQVKRHREHHGEDEDD